MMTPASSSCGPSFANDWALSGRSAGSAGWHSPPNSGGSLQGCAERGGSDCPTRPRHTPPGTPPSRKVRRASLGGACAPGHQGRSARPGITTPAISPIPPRLSPLWAGHYAEVWVRAGSLGHRLVGEHQVGAVDEDAVEHEFEAWVDLEPLVHRLGMVRLRATNLDPVGRRRVPTACRGAVHPENRNAEVPEILLEKKPDFDLTAHSPIVTPPRIT